MPHCAVVAQQQLTAACSPQPCQQDRIPNPSASGKALSSCAASLTRPEPTILATAAAPAQSQPHPSGAGIAPRAPAGPGRKAPSRNLVRPKGPAVSALAVFRGRPSEPAALCPLGPQPRPGRGCSSPGGGSPIPRPSQDAAIVSKKRRQRWGDCSR